MGLLEGLWQEYFHLAVVMEYPIYNKILVDEIGYSMPKSRIGHGWFSKVEPEIPVSLIQRHGNEIFYESLTDPFPDKINLTFFQCQGGVRKAPIDFKHDPIDIRSQSAA